MELDEPIVGKMHFRASFKILNADISTKMWLKWKGRKVPGWSSNRSFYRHFNPERNRYETRGCVTFTCKDIKHFNDMTPEKIQEIVAMITMLKGIEK